MPTSEGHCDVPLTPRAFGGTGSLIAPIRTTAPNAGDSKLIVMLTEQLRIIRSSLVSAEQICDHYEKFGLDVVEGNTVERIAAQAPPVPGGVVPSFFSPALTSVVDYDMFKTPRHVPNVSDVIDDKPPEPPRLLMQPEHGNPRQVSSDDVIPRSESSFSQLAPKCAMSADIRMAERAQHAECLKPPKESLQMRAKALVAAIQYDAFFTLMVACNCVFIGVQVDFQTVQPTAPPQLDQYIISFIFAVIFTVELIPHIIAEQTHFCIRSPNRAWELFDSFLVVTSWIEIIVDTMVMNQQGSEMLQHNFSSARILRVVRISRLLRVVRVARVIRVVTSLRTLVLSVAYTIKVVVWALVLLCMNVTVFALLLTQAVADYKASIPPGSPPDIHLDTYWGRLHLSMLTLFEISSGGLDWHNALVPLYKVGAFWTFVFLLYVVVTVFCVLNVITGVFCESSIEAAKKCQDVAIDEILADREAYIRDAKKLFNSIDRDESGLIAVEDLLSEVLCPRSAAFFEFLGVRVCDAYELVSLVCEDDTVGIQFDDFIEAMLRLKGNARAIDIEKVLREERTTRTAIMEALTSLGAVMGTDVRGHVSRKATFFRES
eukprot:TRINITY_DN1018_c0_g1_i6.p1 TRINITY_DN1018_c0_g1~~TRINITY_DN1018_c0_g1_i6.p1  ORF type:complete len:602 (-),score=89.89 TRINITY_DN1018_c0_g1_i6:78-1883(-)